MNTNTQFPRKTKFNRLISLTLGVATILATLCLFPARVAAGQLKTFLYVGSFEHSLQAGQQFNVTLTLQTKTGHNPGIGLAQKQIRVQAYHTQAEAFFTYTYTSHSDGTITVSFTMPPEAKDKNGKPVSSVVIVHAEFDGGSGYDSCEENEKIQIADR